MPSRALSSGNSSDRAWMKYSWRNMETRMKNRIVLKGTEDRERQGRVGFAVFELLLILLINRRTFDGDIISC